MEYNCKLADVLKVPLNHKGDIEPLCNKCASLDCSNPIEIRKISIRGVVKEYKLFIRGNEARMVIACEGFLPNEE